MITVFICEDNPKYMELIRSCVLSYIFMEDYDMELALFTPKADEILKYITTFKVNGLYFLDVELEEGDNGVELARKIRQHDPRGFIAFVTAHQHYMQITFEYQVEAMAYINKNDANLEEKICDCIKNAYAKHVSRADEGRFIFKSLNGRQVAVSYSDILFFETNGNSIDSHTENDAFQVKHKLYELEEILPSNFVRVSKSTILNINKIYSIDKNIVGVSEVQFYKTHKQVHVSRLYYKKTLYPKLQARLAGYSR